MSVYADLKRARKLIARCWGQGRDGGFLEGKPGQAHCAASALMKSCDYSKARMATATAALRLPRPYPHATPIQTLTTWNDAKGQTKAGVLAEFDQALKTHAPRTFLGRLFAR